MGNTNCSVPNINCRYFKAKIELKGNSSQNISNVHMKDLTDFWKICRIFTPYFIPNMTSFVVFFTIHNNLLLCLRRSSIPVPSLNLSAVVVHWTEASSLVPIYWISIRNCIICVIVRNLLIFEWIVLLPCNSL